MNRRLTNGGRTDTRDRGPFVTDAWGPAATSRALTARDAVERLMAAFPERDAWPRLSGESYGPQYLNPTESVERVLYAVTCTPEVEALFTREDYDLLVLHHPTRPHELLPHIVLHTPFDCGVGGLNDLWRDALGLQDARHIVDNLGWYGIVPTVSARVFRDRVRAVAGGIDGLVYTTVPVVGSVAVCAGLGGWIADEVRALNVSAFVTGELTQWPADIGCPVVIEVGHTRSERIGVDAIQRVLGPAVTVDVAPLGDDRFGQEVFRVPKNIPA